MSRIGAPRAEPTLLICEAVVDDQRASFAAGEVLRRMKAQGRHPTMRAQWTTSERPEESVGIVLDDPRSVLLGQTAQLIQLAADTCIVHRYDAAGPRGDAIGDEL